MEGSENCTGEGELGDGDELCVPDQCLLPTCGDGIVQPDVGETCDPEAEPWESGGGCGADCIVATCGNGDPDPYEECDDGNDVDSDACTNRCFDAECGDGFVQPDLDEECDDTNLDNTDSCTNLCKWNTCGDGVRYLLETDPNNPAPLEQCDIGGAFDQPFGVGEQQECPGEFWGDTEPEDCGDGYYDESDFCSNDCELECFPSRAWAREWKTNQDPSYCVFVAEEHGDLDDTAFEPRSEVDQREAVDHCESFGIGAHLVRIDNDTQNEQLNQLRSNPNVDLAFFPFWIGLNDRSQYTGQDDEPGDWFWYRDDMDLITEEVEGAVWTPLDLDEAPWIIADGTEEPNDLDGSPNTPGQEQCAVMIYADYDCDDDNLVSADGPDAGDSNDCNVGDPTDSECECFGTGTNASWSDRSCASDEIDTLFINVPNGNSRDIHFFCEFPLVEGLPIP
jgi:cysteine-rich repeat protein